MFCHDLLDEVDKLGGGWSDCGGGREDVHLTQIGYDQEWLHILDTYVRPLQEKVFLGYYSRPPRATMNLVLSENLWWQPCLKQIQFELAFHDLD